MWWDVLLLARIRTGSFFLATSRPAATIGVSGRKRRWHLGYYPKISCCKREAVKKSRAYSHLLTSSGRFIFRNNKTLIIISSYASIAFDQQSTNLSGCSFPKGSSNTATLDQYGFGPPHDGPAKVGQGKTLTIHHVFCARSRSRTQSTRMHGMLCDPPYKGTFIHLSHNVSIENSSS